MKARKGNCNPTPHQPKFSRQLGIKFPNSEKNKYTQYKEKRYQNNREFLTYVKFKKHSPNLLSVG